MGQIIINGRACAVSELSAIDAESAKNILSERLPDYTMVGAIRRGRAQSGRVVDLVAFCEEYRAKWGALPSLTWGRLIF